MSLSVRVETPRRGHISLIIERLGDKVIENADQFASDMITKWHDYTYDGWPLGPDIEEHTHSRDTIEEPFKLGDGHYQFRITADYAGVIEYGGYRGVGPKTQAIGGQTFPGGVSIDAGIYTRPAAPLRRALSKVKLEMAQTLAPKLMRASGFRGLAGGGTSTAFRGGN